MEVIYTISGSKYSWRPKLVTSASDSDFQTPYFTTLLPQHKWMALHDVLQGQFAEEEKIRNYFTDSSTRNSGTSQGKLILHYSPTQDWPWRTLRKINPSGQDSEPQIWLSLLSRKRDDQKYEVIPLHSGQWFKLMVKELRGNEAGIFLTRACRVPGWLSR